MAEADEQARLATDGGGQETGEADQFTLEGLGRLNPSGSTSSGTLTLPKAVTEPLLAECGMDFAVFSDGTRVLLVPRTEVTTDV